MRRSVICNEFGKGTGARDRLRRDEYPAAARSPSVEPVARGRAAYLTVSEIFPLEIRALAISIFYSAGTLVGGVGAPLPFGVLIGSGSRAQLLWGYLLGGGLMVAAAIAELFLGVAAERQSLEKISKPLQSR
jgi:hypothetical protein